MAGSRKWILGFGAVFLVAIAGTVLLHTSWFSSKISAWLAETVRENYGVRLQIGSLEYHVLNGLTADLQNIKAFGESSKTPFFSARRIQVRAPYSILWSDHKQVDSIVLESPSLDIEHLPRFPRSESDSSSTLEIREVRLEQGNVALEEGAFSNLKVKLSFNDNELNIQSASAVFEGIHIQGRGKIGFEPLKLDLAYESRGDISSARKLVSGLRGISGPFQAKGKVTGKPPEIRIDADISSTGIRLGSGSAAPVQGKVAYRFNTQDVPLSVQLEWKDFPLSSLLTIDPGIPEIASYSRGTLSYSGNLDFWKGKGTYETSLTPVSGKRPVSGNILGELVDGALRITRSDLRMHSLNAKASGWFSDDQMRLDFIARAGDLRDVRVLSSSIPLISAAGEIAGTLEGLYESLGFRGSASLTRSDGRVAIKKLSYNFSTEDFSIDFDGNITGAALSDFGVAGIAGDIQFAGCASGDVSHPVISLTASSQDLLIRGIAVGAAGSYVQSDGRQLKVQTELPGMNSALDGTYAWKSGEFQAHAEFKELPVSLLRSFLPGKAKALEGNLSGSLSMKGKADHWRSAQGELRIESAILRHPAWNLESTLAGSVLFQQQTLSIDLQAQAPAANGRVQGKIELAGREAMDLHIDALLNPAQMDRWVAPFKIEGEPLHLVASLNGTLNKPQPEGRLEFSGIGIVDPVRKVSLRDLSGTLELREQRLNAALTGQLNDAPLSLEALVPFDSQAGNVHLKVSGLELASFFPESNLAGELQLEISATGNGLDLKEWDGTAVLQTIGLRSGEHNLSFESPVSMSLQDGVLSVLPFHATAAGLLDIRGGGSYKLSTESIDATLQGQADLAVLSDFVPSIQGSGLLQMSILASGSIRKPIWEGHVEGEGLFAQFTDYPFVLEDIRFHAPFDAEGLQVQEFTARLGGGTVQGSGRMKFEQGKPGPFQLQVAGRNMGLNYPQGLRSQLDADLSWNGTTGRSEISGNVRVLRSTYREDVNYRDRLINSLLSQQQDLSIPAEAPGNVRLNIKVTTVQPFQLKNNMAKLRSSGDFVITGTVVQPRINGQLRVREGSLLFFEGNEFVVDHAALSFFGTPNLNPVVDASLSTTLSAHNPQGEMQDYFITISLNGPMDNLTREITSDPALSEAEAYSLLLTGEVRDLGQTAAIIFQRQFASYLSGQLFFNFQERIARTLGLSQFEILPPDLIASEEDPAVRLIVSKELAAGLQVQYSSLLSQHTDATWIVNYRLKNRLQVRFVDQDTGKSASGNNVKGGYTGGVRHSLLFGGGPRARSHAVARAQKIVAVNVSNESVLSDDSIRQLLGVRAGQTYDPWELEERAEQVKEALQQRGFLYPSVDIAEHSKDGVQLEVRVADRGKRRMEFGGLQVSGDSISKYSRWWREGLSEAVVVQQIRDDLLSALYEAGHHRAAIHAEQQHVAGEIIYRFTAEPGPLFPQVELRFEGNAHYPAGELEGDLVALYGSSASAQQAALHRFNSFAGTVAALYVQRGYLDAQVKQGISTIAPPLLQKSIRIEEGTVSRISRVEFSSGQEIPADLRQNLELAPGGLLAATVLSDDEFTIADYYQRQGYWNTRISAEVSRETGGLAVTYALDTGDISRIGAIKITGNHVTRESLILRRISLRAGDLLTRDALMQTQNRIEQLNVFRQVRIEPRETAVPGVYDLNIQVVEREPYELSYGVRYDSELDFEGEVQFSNSNLLGTGQNVLFYGRWNSLDNIYRLIFHSAPGAQRRETLLTIPWRTLVSLSYEDREQPQFFSKLASVNLQRRWEFLRPFVFLTNYKFEQGHITSKETGGQVEFDLKQNISRLIGVVILDTRDDPFDPRHGLLLTDEIEHAPDALNDFLVFTKNYFQYFQYFSLGRVVSASAVRVGLGTELIGSERFRAGGQATIRGFELDEVGPHSRFTGDPIGGEGLLILNQEFRFPMYSWLGGVLFYDGGNVYESASDMSLSDIRHTAGLGLRLNSPYGVGRLDIGFNLDPQNEEPSYVLHFGFGQAW